MIYTLLLSTNTHLMEVSKKPKKSRNLLGTADMIKDRMRKDFKLCLLKCFFLCSFSSFLIQGTCESHLVSIVLSILPLKGKSLNFNLSVKDSLSTTKRLDLSPLAAKKGNYGVCLLRCILRA